MLILSTYLINVILHGKAEDEAKQWSSIAGEWVAGQPKWVAPLEVDAAGDPRDGRGEAVAQAMDAARLARAAGLRCASFAREYAKADGNMQVCEPTK